MFEVLYFRLEECAFLQFQFQPVFCQSREHRVQSFELFSDSRWEDEDIIQVAEQDTEHFLAESCLHESLEGGGCVTQSECHSSVFVQAKWGGEGSLVLVFRVHRYLGVGRLQVQCAEPPGTCQRIHRLVNQWQWIRILHGLRVQRTEVATHAQGPRSFPHEHNSTGKVTLALHNCTRPHQALKMIFDFIQLYWRDPSVRHANGDVVCCPDSVLHDTGAPQVVVWLCKHDTVSVKQSPYFMRLIDQIVICSTKRFLRGRLLRCHTNDNLVHAHVNSNSTSREDTRWL